MSQGHVHDTRDADSRSLTIALGLILGFMVLEVAAGIVASSLALISDSAHMLTDAFALGLSLLAARLAVRPAQGSLTYGLGRAEILSAQANGVTLLIDPMNPSAIADAILRVIETAEDGTSWCASQEPTRSSVSGCGATRSATCSLDRCEPYLQRSVFIGMCE